MEAVLRQGTRILLLSQWFEPEPTFKGLAFARELVRLGYQVEVLTGFPNYPGGEVYPGYKLRFRQREVIDGINVTRVWLYPSHDSRAIHRILNYVSFAASALFHGLFSVRRSDVIYAYHPPVTTGLIAVLLRAFRRIPVVYDIQDMWPDTLRATGMVSNERILCLIGKFCDWCYRHVDRIVVLSPGFRSLLEQRGVPSRKIDVIYNWSNEGSSNTSAWPNGNLPEELAKSGRFRIVFAGNMGRAQGLESVLAAARIVQDEHPDAFEFMFIGGGVELATLKSRAAEMGLNNVRFEKAVPMSEIGVALASADALLVHLKDDPLFKITVPSKTQAYMAAGRPLLMAVGGDADELVTRSACGVLARPEDPRSLAAAAVRLYEMSDMQRAAMGNNAQNFYAAELSLASGAAKFAAIFDAVVRNRRRH